MGSIIHTVEKIRKVDNKRDEREDQLVILCTMLLRQQAYETTMCELNSKAQMGSVAFDTLLILNDVSLQYIKTFSH